MTIHGVGNAASDLDHAGVVARAWELTGRPAEPLDGDLLSALFAEAGEIALASASWSSAFELLSLAIDLGHGDTAITSARLYLLGIASEGVGSMEQARRHFRNAAELAEQRGDGSMVVRAATRCLLPSDWRSNDAELAELLRRASALDLADDERVALQSVCAMADMRTATADHAGQLLGWATRADVGQPLADEALAASAGCSDATRALALLAWRSTHRGPQWLERRLETSDEVLTLAQQLDDRRTLVDAGIWRAVDALEAGDRDGFDEMISLVRSTAERDGSPRLIWRATTIRAGRAFADGDIAHAAQLRRACTAVGRPIDLPGWLGADLFFRGEEAILSNNKGLMEPFVVDHSFDGVDNAIGRAGVAYMCARLGDSNAAVQHLARGFRLADDESSILHFGTRAAAAALAIGQRDLLEAAAEVLEPWHDRVSVDTNAWWCDGPVALWSAAIRARLDDQRSALMLLDIGESLAKQIRHPASLRRAQLLRLQLE